MDNEMARITWTIFVAIGSIFVGILVLVMFVLTLKRKGTSALLLLPLILWLFFWQSWHASRYDLVAFLFDYDTPGLRISVAIVERLITTSVVLLALLLIFKKDKPKTEEPSYRP